MEILHISAECYPAAKAGGLGDVAGALPKYLIDTGMDTSVIIPKYQTKWLNQQTFKEIFAGDFYMGQERISFTIHRVEKDPTGFPLYVADIPGKFDRPGVYLDGFGNPFGDELARAISFQLASLYWVRSLENRPKVLHCHDHHTGLIPFLIRHAYAFTSLKNTPTVFTIHNGEYHGAFHWNKLYLLPAFDSTAGGLLDWHNMIVPIAAAIKCCWKLTTVSPGYMEELKHNSKGLEGLIKAEQGKSIGILNGIDTKVWDPRKDEFITKKLARNFKKYKAANRQVLYDQFNINEGLPTVVFIGRLVREKGAELLPEAISRFIYDEPDLGFIVLGTGDPNLHQVFSNMRNHFPGRFDAALEYNEGLAHQLYAGADVLLMPSLVEPCGLNQMYAMRYGSVPIVRSVGGLRDTVPDIGREKGAGICFDYYSVDEIHHALSRAKSLASEPKKLMEVQKRNTKVDFSWEQSAKAYGDIYQELIKS